MYLEEPRVYFVVENYGGGDEDSTQSYLYAITATRADAEVIMAAAERRFDGTNSTFFISDRALEVDWAHRRLLDDFDRGVHDQNPDRPLPPLSRTLRI